MELIIAPTDNPYRQQENLALQAFYEDVLFACSSCASENTVESMDLPKDSPHHGAVAPKQVAADDDNTHYMVACGDCGQVTQGVLPARFSQENGWIMETIWHVHVGDVVVGWGVIDKIRPSSDGMAYIVTTKDGYTFDYPDGDDVIVQHQNDCGPIPDENMRELGYAELHDRMRRALYDFGDRTLVCQGLVTEPSPYFVDGNPVTLLGHVLAELGVDPTRAGAVIHYNDRPPGQMFPAAGFELTEQAEATADLVWQAEMRGHSWRACIDSTVPGPKVDQVVPDDWTTLAEIEYDRRERERATREAAAAANPVPDKVIRPLGFTELVARLRHVLIFEGDTAICGWDNEFEPPPGYFNENDGTPDGLFGHVLAGLGVRPEQVLTHHEQRDMVLAGRASWDDVIAETLRAEAPVAHLPFRFAVDDVEVCGVRIAKGEPVLMCFAAVGRDPELHGETAARFDITRAGKENLSFGYGIYRCIGSALALLETRIALSLLFDRFPRMSLAVPLRRLEPQGTFIMNGDRALPVLLT
ncbi:cytochrome P450 [Kutzneria sp. NPDC052558]|uniref:cytochrome P450 n=1 Tax=Kutzneria sp. NPDC052558 TaxID=3364121 RepID=UPI0037CBCD28